MGHAEWASGDWPGVDDFLEYECRLNDIIPQYKDAVICLYNLTKCGGNLILDVMRTHPMILIGGIVQENPFFVPQIGRASCRERVLSSVRAVSGEHKRDIH